MQLVHAAGHPAKHLARKALSTQQALFFSQLNSFIPQSLCFALAQLKYAHVVIYIFLNHFASP